MISRFHFCLLWIASSAGTSVRIPLPKQPSFLNLRVEFAATPPQDGTLGRYYRLPAGVSYLIPDSMTLEDAAMVTSFIPSRLLPPANSECRLSPFPLQSMQLPTSPTSALPRPSPCGGLVPWVSFAWRSQKPSALQE